MVKITAGGQSIELTSGTRYELETVPKYFLKIAEFTVATFYRSGIVKSIGDVDLATFRTLGGSLVVLETDIKTGGYLTHQVRDEDRQRFISVMDCLVEMREACREGEPLEIEYCEQMEYEPDVPTRQEIHDFFCRIKSLSELDALAMQINDLLGPMDIVHPTIGDLDYLAYSLSSGCDGGCAKCSFQHMRSLTPRSKTDLQAQISLYKNIFPARERAHFEIFAGNHRGLGIDFELFSSFIEQIRNDAGMTEGRVFTFCNAEDILRLSSQYGMRELERRMLHMGVSLNFGVESGSCQGLQEYGKNTSVHEIRQALTLLKKTRIPHSVNIISGADWENHTWETVKLFRSLYRPGENRPMVYASEFIDEKGRIDRPLAAKQYQMFRDALNDCGIYVFRYTFVPFNTMTS
jgi:hypothetical protein